VFDPGATYINRLSIRSRRGRDAARRFQLEQQLRSLDLRPSGLPPSALLLVRRIADPLPRWLSAHQTSRLSPRWERAVCERLDQDYRNAARPVRGRVPAGTASVLLADESELLACLALALARGELAAHWCWPLALHRYAVAGRARLEGLLVANARLVPAVIAQLVLWEQCSPVLSCFQDDMLDDLVRALSMEHALDINVAPEQSAEVPEDAGAAASPARLSRADPSPSPWRKWLDPVQKDQLGLDQLGLKDELFVGLALMLHYQPAQARSPLFRAQLRSWFRDRAASAAPHAEGEVAALDDMSRPSRGNRSVAGQLPEGAPRKALAGSGSPPSELVSADTSAAPSVSVGRWTRKPAGPDRVEAKPEPARASRPTARDRLTRDQSTALELPGSFATATEQSNGSLSDGLAAQVSNAVDSESQVDSSSDSVLESPDDWASDWPDDRAVSGVATRLGGALYLINLMRHLGLPECFEPSWGLGRDLGPWGLLELITRALLGEDHDAHASDPLWRVLAELDSRAPGDWPDEAVAANDVYRIPDHWIDEPPEHLYWGTADRCLRLWADRGFLIADIPRGAQPAIEQAITEARRYPELPVPTSAPFDSAPAARLHQALQDALGPAMAFWLRSVIPYLRWRLDQAAPAALDPLGDLLLVSGRLYVTRAHVDLVTSLECISLPARLAGLDRDPGWAGDWGRVVSFHFQ
jgi:hypothetical protein